MNDRSEQSAHHSPANPFMGLASFGEIDSAYFFGRDRELHDFLSMVRRETLTILFGISGLGKTSLLRAGLFPRLRQENYLPISIRIDYVQGGSNLAEQVLGRVLEEAKANGAVVELQNIDLNDLKNATLWEYFHRAQFWSAKNDPLVPVLVFDQFEEIFTIGDLHPGLAAFKTEVADLLENRIPQTIRDRLEATGAALDFNWDRPFFKTIVSLREDFLPHLEQLGDLIPTLKRNRMRLTRMNGEQALDAVLKPAPGLIDGAVARRIVSFVANADRSDDEPSGGSADLSRLEVEPALLSVVCRVLNEKRIEQGLAAITPDLLTVSRAGILNDFYESATRGLPDHVRTFIEERLLTTSGYRNSVAREDALSTGDLTSEQLDTLVDRRLLRVEDRLGTQHVELTHDVLTHVIRESRDHRRASEAESHLLQQERERNERLIAQQRIQRRRLRWVVAGALALLVVSAGAGLFIYDAYFRRQVQYFNRLDKRYGLPVGMGPLQDWQRKGRAVSYRFTRKGRRSNWQIVEAVDSTGQLTTRHTYGAYAVRPDQVQSNAATKRACRWEFLTDSRGFITYEVAYDKSYRMVSGIVYSPLPADDRDTKLHPRERTARLVGERGYALRRAESEADYVEIVYDAQGWEQALCYRDRQGQAALGPDRSYAMHYERDANGAVTAIDSMNREWNEAYRSTDAFAAPPDVPVAGHRMPDGDAIGRMELSLDTMGNPVLAKAFDLDGKPTRSNQGLGQLKVEYNPQGNMVKLVYLSPEGKPTLCNDGYHMLVMSYDDRGDISEQRLFSTQGRPILHVNGFATLRQEHDLHHNQTGESYFDEHDQPVLHKQGFHRSASRFDDAGNQIELATYGIDNHLIANVGGFAIRREEYDGLGNSIKTTFFDTQGKPGFHKEGYHGWLTRYNGLSKPVELSCIGVQGEPRSSTEGWAKIKMDYDERGNLIRNAFFGIHDEPVVNSEGVASFRSVYDDRGHEIEESAYDVKGNPCRRSAGYCKERKQYDERGLRTEWACFGIHDEPVIDQADKTHRAVFKHDLRGNELQRDYFGTDGKPCLYENDYARVTYQYDADGHEIEAAYFGTRLEPIVNRSEGYHRRALRYNEMGNLVQREFFGLRNTPAADSSGFHRYEKKYAEDGSLIEDVVFDTQDRQIPTAVHVQNVAAGGQGSKLGIAPGDWITKYAGQPVTSIAMLIALTAAAKSGGTIEVLVNRDGQEMHLNAQPGQLGIRGETVIVPQYRAEKLMTNLERWSQKIKSGATAPASQTQPGSN